MRKLYFVVVLLLGVLPAFSQLYKVENAEKEQNASLIVEGKVVEQTSFWNAQHTMIFTTNKVKVFKRFKGEVPGDFIEIMTIGGTVGTESVHASELLELNRDEIGVFFCFPNHGNILSPVTGARLFDVYASSQGFFKYDVFNDLAGDPFNTFNGITEQLYPAITALTKQNFTVVDPTFSVNKTTTGLSGKSNALITSFTPAVVNAGATLDAPNNVLTINGTGFGTPSGSAAILFWDANNNNGTPAYVVAYSASEIISWTDTEIKVRVPTRAGTGTFSVRDAAGATTTSPNALVVNYSILTNNGRQSNLVNANSAGGYFMRYSANMTPEATTTFNRALETWVEVSGLNVVNGGTTGTESVASDGNCVVMMDGFSANNGTPLSAGVLGVCYSFSITCSGGAFDVRKPEFDIVLRSSFSSGSANFSYGPCAPLSTQIDLETVILHELGHGLNLGHINDGSQGAAPNANPGKLMHYAVSNGVKRTSPDNSAYMGSLYTINGVTTNYGACWSQGNMTALTATTDPRDEMPLTFPAIPTAGGVSYNVDLEHATSNKKNDPPYNIILCTPLPQGTNITNNIYIPIRTSATGGELSVTVNDFQLTPASAATECTGGNTPAMRLALFYRLTMPTDPGDYGDPVACRSFSGNGTISTITGLLPNSTYLLYVDAKANAKASFTLVLNGTALPLKLEKFVGEAKKDHNLLTWKIASFQDVEKLVLQKSGNGSDFSPIFDQKIFETGKEYKHADFNPFAGKNYYRLAVYNKSGSVEYSSVVELNNQKDIDVSVYPNPVRDRLNISVSTAQVRKDVQLSLFNSIGQLVVSKKINLVAGANLVDVNMSAFSSGIYKLQLTDVNGNTISTVTVQK